MKQAESTEVARFGWFVAAPVIAILSVLIFWLLIPNRYQVPTLLEYTNFYEPVARSLLAGDGLTMFNGTPAVRYPPGHPLVLAATFELAGFVGVPESLALGLLILGCWGLTAAALFVVSRDVWGAKKGLMVPISFAIYPLALWLTLQPISEISFLPVLALAVWLVWRGLNEGSRPPWQFAVAGVAVGAAMLIRPAAIGLGLVMAGVVVYASREHFRRGILGAGFLLLGCVLVILPWETFVYSKTGSLVPLSTGGPSSIHDGLTFAVRDKGYRSAPPASKAVAEFMGEVDRRFVESGSLRIAPAVFDAARIYPVGALRLGIWKGLRAWYGTDSRRLEGWLIAIQIPVLAILGIATTRAVRMGGEPRLLAVLLLALVAYFWFVTTTALSIVRYMTPAICLWFLVLPALFKGGVRVSAKHPGETSP